MIRRTGRYPADVLVSLAQTGSPAAAVADRLQEELRVVEELFERQLASDLPAVNALCRHVERYRGKMLRPTLVLLTGMAAAGTAASAPDGHAKPPLGPAATPALGRGNALSLAGEEADGGGGRGAGAEHRRGRTAARLDSNDLAREDPQLPEQGHRHRVVAAVVEMIHMATLVHDDVLDEAEVRRQGATVNHLRGNEVAVMLGDFLISNAFHLCSTLGDPSINLFLGETTNTLCEGELVQLHHRENLSLDEATYFEIVRRKTAVLVGGCCRLGASLAGAPPRLVEAMRGFGSALGVAFQIQDDLLDLAGRPDVVGKTLGRDLEKGKLTLPLILHLAAATPQERSAAIDLIERREAATLLARLQEEGAVAAARRRAEELVEAGKRELELLPPTPARELLSAMADAVVAREA